MKKEATMLIFDAQTAQFDEKIVQIHTEDEVAVHLPSRMYVDGDYMAIPSFNEALESGVNARDAFNRGVESREMRRKY